jgi:mono/diheme cytochrome c family protein
MHDQPKYQPLEASTFFADGRSARPPVPGTVARGEDDLRADDHLYLGKVDGVDVDAFPFPVTADVLARGRDRYSIYCTPCHGAVGDGNGMVVRRGYRRPPSFHDDRLRQSPPGHYFDVMTNGFGAMADYASQIRVRDRWAIIAYIRALQLSQHATIADVPAGNRQELAGGQEGAR